jgi:hypothetical protein
VWRSLLKSLKFGAVLMLNNPADILIKIKGDLKKCADKWSYLQNVDNALYDQGRKVITKICIEDSLEIPTAIVKCLDMEEFMQYAYFQHEESYGVSVFIQDTFNPFIDICSNRYLQVQFIPVEFLPPNILSYEHIRDEIKKCDTKLKDGDYSGAITNARSLLEGVLKEIIYNISGEHSDPKKDLVKLLNDGRNFLNLDPSKPELIEPLKQVITGLASTVQGLGTIRNVISDSHSRKYELSAHHAILVVNASKTIASFLFGTYEYQLSKGTIKNIAKGN